MTLSFFLNKVSLFAQLGKIRITIFVALSSLAGYFLIESSPAFKAFLIALGVFFTATSASALNQLQEIRYDALMIRTQRRPLVSNKISKAEALIFILLAFSIGFCVLLTIDYIAALLSLLAIIWYNGVYVYLKRISALSILPGSIVGAIPPYIGYAGANGNILSADIFFLALVFFLWQLPHFWLLSVLYNEDYKRANFPTLLDRIDKATFDKLIFASVAIMQFFAYYFIFNYFSSPVAGASIFSVSVLRLLFLCSKSFKSDASSILYKKIFLALNLNMLLFSFLVSLDSFIN